MIADVMLNLFQKDPTVKRHLLKTVSWRLVGTFDTVLLGWFVTGQISTGAKIGGMELITKMILYFFHERAWHRISFGIPTRSNRAELVKKENSGNLFHHKSSVSRHQMEELNQHKSFTIWLTGLSGSGKSSIAAKLDSWFYNEGIRSYVIDGDNTRIGINSDLSFSKDDRKENIRRVAEICKLFNEAGTIVIASFIAPFAEDREMAKIIIGAESFVETFIDASIETCKARDMKGLYKLAEDGKIKNFTGIDSPYDRPTNPAIHIHSDSESLDDSFMKIINHLISHKVVSVLPKVQLSHG